ERIGKRLAKQREEACSRCCLSRFSFGDVIGGDHEVEGRNLLACAGRSLSGEPAARLCSREGVLDARSHGSHAVVLGRSAAVERWVYFLQSIGAGCIECLESISRSRAVCRNE